MNPYWWFSSNLLAECICMCFGFWSFGGSAVWLLSFFWFLALYCRLPFVFSLSFTVNWFFLAGLQWSAVSPSCRSPEDSVWVQLYNSAALQFVARTILLLEDCCMFQLHSNLQDCSFRSSSTAVLPSSRVAWRSLILQDRSFHLASCMEAPSIPYNCFQWRLVLVLLKGTLNFCPFFLRLGFCHRQAVSFSWGIAAICFNDYRLLFLFSVFIIGLHVGSPYTWVFYLFTCLQVFKKHIDTRRSFLLFYWSKLRAKTNKIF